MELQSPKWNLLNHDLWGDAGQRVTESQYSKEKTLETTTSMILQCVVRVESRICRAIIIRIYKKSLSEMFALVTLSNEIV